LLGRAGLDRGHLAIVPLEFESAARSLLNDGLDAAVLSEPDLSIAGRRPGYKVLLTSRDSSARGALIDVLVVSDAAAKTRQRELEGLVRAWFRAIDLVHASPPRAYRIMGKHFDLLAMESAPMLSGVRFVTAEANQALLAGTAAEGRLERLAARVLDLQPSATVDAIRRRPDSTWLAPDPLRAALRLRSGAASTPPPR
jgi:hypothetical protein